MDIYRGEIYFVELGPTRGKEIDFKKRPVVVLSVNEINQKPLVVAVIPGGTHKVEKPVHRTEVKVEPSPTNGLSVPTIFQCHQIKAIDKSRFVDNPAGILSLMDLRRIEETTKLCLGLT